MITVIIFSYNRKESLKRVLSSFGAYSNECEIHVLDDGSTYQFKRDKDISKVNYYRLKHTGKKGFYKKWIDALYICQHSDSDLFIFMPDDFYDIDLDRVKVMHTACKHAPYAYNLYNCGRKVCWTGVRPTEIRIKGENVTEVGFVDCGFFCNRRAIEKLGYTMLPIKGEWFDRENKSSGVGYQLSTRFRRGGVLMYMPHKSIANHGDDGTHDSVMHPESNVLRSLSNLTAHVVNLPDRSDKLEAFASQQFPFDIQIKDAIKTTPGWVGCRDTHLELFRKISGVTLIMEDDFLMLESWDFVLKCIQQLPDDWDMLYLGSTLNEPLQKYSENLYRIKKGWTTHGIIYNGDKVPKFVLANQKDVLKIDVFLSDVVQEKFNCFITYPMAATQRAGYSDVVNKDVDYKVITDRYKQYVK